MSSLEPLPCLYGRYEATASSCFAQLNAKATAKAKAKRLEKKLANLSRLTVFVPNFVFLSPVSSGFLAKTYCGQEIVIFAPFLLLLTKRHVKHSLMSFRARRAVTLYRAKLTGWQRQLYFHHTPMTMASIFSQNVELLL